MSGPAKLFIGNLPPTCTQSRLEELAAQFGQVTHVHIMTRQAASGAICAFVEMASHEQAKMVISGLDGKVTVPPHTTPVSVSFAIQHPRGGAPPPGNSVAVLPKLFVGNLPGDITEASLDGLFRQYGRLERVVMVAKPSPSGNRSAFVIFSNVEECKYAIQVLDGRYTFPNGRDTIVVRFADNAAGGPERRYGGGPFPGDASARLFVGNLPDTCTQEALVTLMTNYGQVINSHMMTTPSASGAICAFIEYADPMQAKSAIMALDGVYPFPPRPTPMTVSYAKAKGRQGYDGWGGSQQFGGEAKLFVGNLPGDVTQEQLWEMFFPFGNLIEAFLFKRGPETAKGAFVRFSDWANAQQAIAAMHGRDVRGNSIVVEPARPSDGKGGKGGEAPPVTPPPLYNYNDPTVYYQAWSQYYAQMGYAMPAYNAAQWPPTTAAYPAATAAYPYGASAPAASPPYPSAPAAIAPPYSTASAPAPTPAPPAAPLSGAGALGFANFPTAWDPSATSSPYLTSEAPPVGYSAGAVEAAQPMTSGAGFSQGIGQAVTLSLTNLPPEYDETAVAALFTNFPGYQGCHVHKAGDGVSASANVTFLSSETAYSAQTSLNNFVVGQHRLSCTIRAAAARPY